MRLAIAGGGTGGHLFPGLALAEELLARDPENAVLFLGAHGGLEERVVPLHRHRLELLPSLKGGVFGLDVLRKTARVGRGYLRARRLLMDFGAQAVVGLGGYASALPVLAAWGVQVPCLMLEQNAIPGRVTRRLGFLAREIGVQFAESARCLGRPPKVRHVGNPLRRRLAVAAAKAAERNLSLRPPAAEPHLLVLGGSQGARFLNDVIGQAWPKLRKAVPGLRVTLVCGREEADRAQSAFSSGGVRGRVIPFCETMEDLYSEADVVLARAGATTLAEVSAFGLPSVLIPYPFAADNHQVANAKVYAHANAAWVLPQATLELDRLVQRIADTVLQKDRRQRMAQASYALAKPRAAAEIVDDLERLAGVRQPAPSPALLAAAAQVHVA